MNGRAVASDPLDRSRFPVDPWRLVECTPESGDLGVTETLFTVANGYVGMRGNPEEGRHAFEHGTYVNGFHDAANSIATVVSTNVLSPRLAVMWAAFFNFVAFLVFGTVVAATIATGVVDPEVLTIGVVFAGLVGAIGWNLITFYLGLPTSSSHALVGGIAGAAVAKAEGLLDDGFRVIFNTGRYGGQEVFHVHAHVLGGEPLGPMIAK